MGRASFDLREWLRPAHWVYFLWRNFDVLQVVVDGGMNDESKDSDIARAVNSQTPIVSDSKLTIPAVTARRHVGVGALEVRRLIFYQLLALFKTEYALRLANRFLEQRSCIHRIYPSVDYPCMLRRWLRWLYFVPIVMISSSILGTQELCFDVATLVEVTIQCGLCGEMQVSARSVKNIFSREQLGLAVEVLADAIASSNTTGAAWQLRNHEIGLGLDPAAPPYKLIFYQRLLKQVNTRAWRVKHAVTLFEPNKFWPVADFLHAQDTVNWNRTGRFIAQTWDWLVACSPLSFACFDRSHYKILWFNRQVRARVRLGLREEFSNIKGYSKPPNELERIVHALTSFDLGLEPGKPWSTYRTSLANSFWVDRAVGFDPLASSDESFAAAHQVIGRLHAEEVSLRICWGVQKFNYQHFLMLLTLVNQMKYFISPAYFLFLRLSCVFLCFYLFSDYLPHLPDVPLAVTAIKIVLGSFKNCSGCRVKWYNIEVCFQILMLSSVSDLSD